MILTREDLHCRVWAQPMPRAAADLGVTTAALEGLCRTLDVPFPYSGYWRQGAPLDGRVRTLPRARPGRAAAVELDRLQPPPTPVPRADEPAAPPAAPTANPDAPSRAPIREADPRRGGAEDRPGDPIDRRWGLVHARLGEALARAGHTARMDNGAHGYDVAGQFVTWWIREAYTRTKRPPTVKEARDPWTAARGYVFEERMTGRLILAAQTKAYGRKAEWRDNPRRGRLEDRVDEIVAGLESLADETTRVETERRESAARWVAAEARRRAAEQRAHAEAERWGRLSRLAAQHEDARRVAAFLRRLRAEVGPAVGGDPVLRAWFVWAEDAVDAFDPVTWDMAQVTRHVDRPPRSRSLLEEDDDPEDDDDEVA